MKLIIRALLIVGWYVFLAISSNAQTRGYLGKRFTVELNLNNGYSRITKLNADFNEKISGKVRRYNIYPEFTLSYTVGRRVDIGLLHSRDFVRAQFYELNFEFKGLNNFYTPNLEPAPEQNLNFRYVFLPNKEKSIGFSRMYQFFFRFYTKRSIAPVGFYHQLAIGFNTLGFKNPIKGHLEGTSTLNLGEVVPIELKIQKYNVSKLSYFLGNKKVFTNGLYINSGIGFNFPISYKLAVMERSSSSWKYNYEYISQLDKETIYAQLIEFKIGLGFIF